MNYPFLKKEKFGLRTQETFIGKTCEIYIPEDFFNKSKPEIAIAKELGDRVKTAGIFWFKADGKLYQLKMPIQIEFQFSSSEKKSLKIKPDQPEGTFIVYTLKTGDAFLYDVLHKISVDDFCKFFYGKIFEAGKLPNTVKYEDVLQIFLNAMESSGVGSVGLPSVSIELMISELYRNKKNLSEPFRLAYNGRNSYDYKAVRITKLPALNSTFTSMIGEDINNQIVSSVVRKREGKEEKESPIEDIIKY